VLTRRSLVEPLRTREGGRVIAGYGERACPEAEEAAPGPQRSSVMIVFTVVVAPSASSISTM
jgi:hypothetical protein